VFRLVLILCDISRGGGLAESAEFRGPAKPQSGRVDVVRERRYGIKHYTFRISVERRGSEANSVDSDAFQGRRLQKEASLLDQA